MRLHVPNARVMILALLVGALPARAETPVERGAYLVNALAACAGCHTPKLPPGAPLSGGNAFGPSGIVASNITPDIETGIGTWTDRQIVDAIRNDLRPDGSRLAPPMPQWAYRSMSDADVLAIVAYLRGIPSVRHLIPVVRTTKPSPMPPRSQVASVSAPEANTRVTRGRYIANALSHCSECHTPGPTSAPDVAHHLDDGGRMFMSPKGPIISPSITAASLRRYSDAELTAIITRGTRPDGSKLEGPMPVKSYAGLRPADLADLIAYLRAPTAPSDN